jgi:hypothetical protein
MPLGAYAVVRYTDDVRDERLNLGVLVWHPSDGFEVRFLKSFERVLAIAPNIRLRAIKKTVQDIISRLNETNQGRLTLEALSSEFRHGLQVSGTYPARLHSLGATADRLYSLLVEPPEAPKDGDTVPFELKLSTSLKDEVCAVDGEFEELGKRKINGATVDLGFRTRVGGSEMLWRGVSLRTNGRDDQIARAKATVVDILRQRTIAEFAGKPNIVTVEMPRKPHPSTIHECREQIGSTGAELIEVDDPGSLPLRVRDRLRVA